MNFNTITGFILFFFLGKRTRTLEFRNISLYSIFIFYFTVSIYTCESKLIYSCPNGFTKFGNKCFYLSIKPATWQEAYFECKYMTKGSKLAILPKQTDDHYIRKFLKYRENGNIIKLIKLTTEKNIVSYLTITLLGLK